MGISVTPVAGAVGGECYLVATQSAAFLVDAGFAFCAEKALQKIKKALGGRGLDCILLTHSHYDHVGGAPLIAEAYGGARVVASPQTAAVFARAGARATMEELDATAAANSGEPPCPGFAERLRVDLQAEDGCRVTAGDTSVRVLYTPGHTKCCVSFFFEEEGLLAVSETGGVYAGELGVIPQLIVGYGMALSTIDRMAALGARAVIPAHSRILEGREAADYFAQGRAACEYTAALVEDMWRAGCAQEEICAAYRTRYFGAAKGQPEEAFMLNTRAMVTRLLRELGEAV